MFAVIPLSARHAHLDHFHSLISSLTVAVNNEPYGHNVTIRRDGVWFFLTIAIAIAAGVLMLAGG